MNKIRLTSIDDLLSEDQCLELIGIIDNVIIRRSDIIHSLILSDKLWSYIKDNEQLKSLGITKITNEITIGKTTSGTRLQKHTDNTKDGKDKYKLSIYLNNVNSGTNFYFGKVENKQGRGILFDIRLPHESEPIPEGETKYVIGCRIQ